MRFGIIDHNDDSGRPHVQQVEERLALIEAYDRLGLYAYHLTEHHGTPLAITGSPHLMLAAAARRTVRLRLGTLITILSLYHPMRLIEEAVTLDQLTGGRLDLGVGRGVSPAELAFYGVSGEAEAQERFDEAFEILRRGLTSDSVTFSGKHYTLTEAPVVSRPVQLPHPPLWYGTRTLSKARWCARLGMPMMALVPSAAVRPLTDAYRDEWALIGRPAGELPALGISRNMVLAPTTAEAMKIANRAFARFSRSLFYLWEKYDITPPPVFPADTFEGICATDHFYAGDPAGARDWVARHRDIGAVSYMALETCFGDMTYDEALRTAELLATEVMPYFPGRLLDQARLAEGVGHRAGRGRGVAAATATVIAPATTAVITTTVIATARAAALPVAPAARAALTTVGLRVATLAVGLEVLDLVNALGEGGSLELGARVTAGLLHFAQDVGHGRQAGRVVNEVVRLQRPQDRRVAEEARHVRARHRQGRQLVPGQVAVFTWSSLSSACAHARPLHHRTRNGLPVRPRDGAGIAAHPPPAGHHYVVLPASPW